MGAVGAQARQGARAPLGILAGGSGVPVELAEAVVRSGDSVHIVGLVGEAEPDIAAFPHTWVHWGGIGAMIAAFRAAGCRRLVIVGRVRRPNLLSLRPDLGFWKCLPSLLPFLRGGDDAILRLVVGFFERHGMEVIGAHEAAPELLAAAGLMGRQPPAHRHPDAIALAAAALAAIGPFDAAQAAVASPTSLLAVEGADGTDAMLHRLARQRRHDCADAVLVKLPKPNQERRIDMPAIGPDTVSRAAEAGLAGIAVRTGATLVAERAQVLRQADAAGLFVLGLTDGDTAGVMALEGQSGPQGPERIDTVAALTRIGRRSPSAADVADAEIGARLIEALAPFWSQANVAVSRRYVLAVEGAGGAQGTAERAGRLKPWGVGPLRRKVGVLVMTDIGGEIGHDPAELTTRAKASGLAGIVVLRAPMDDAALALLASEADRAGLFVLAPGSAV